MGLEDYTTYTVVEENDPYSVVANAITVTNLSSGETSYIYKDFGAGNFGDVLLGIDFESIGTASSASSAFLYTFGLSNALNDAVAQFVNNDDSIWVFTFIGGGGQRAIGLTSWNGAQQTDNFLFAPNAWGVRHYQTFTRSGNSATLKIYDDSGRTNLVDTISIGSITVDTFRYLYAANSQGDAAANVITGEIANHEIITADAFGAILMSSSLYLNGGRVW